MQQPPAANGGVAFGPFVLRQQQLLRDGRPLRLGARALSLLGSLVSRQGEVVSVEALKEAVWQGLFVEDANVKVQVSALRKLLGHRADGDDYILTIPKGGYSFVGDLRALAGAHAAAETAPRLASLPGQVAALIGRESAIERLAARLQHDRLVSIVGPGGVGKTSLALALAAPEADRRRDGAAFVDLATLTSADMAKAALAAALGVTAISADRLADTVEAMKSRNALVLLDSCEQLADAAGEIAEALYIGCPEITVLATSREPLRAAGEHVFRLDPLGFPSEAQAVSAREVLAYPAVRLFEERARARLDGYAVTDADAPLVAEICRRLDGLPLAIELAAATVDGFGVRGLASQLGARFEILNQGRRTAVPRQQTLRATLDWSYQALPGDEQRVLRRLSIFAGSFSLEAASRIARCPRICPQQVVGAVAELAAKSLLTVDLSHDEVRYRLLESTRLYCLEHLKAGGEFEALTLVHADWCKMLLDEAERSWTSAVASAWNEQHRWLIDDVRIALGRCAELDGALYAGCDLIASATPLFYRLSLVETLDHAERLLAHFAEAGRDDPRRFLEAKIAQGVALWYGRGFGPETRRVWSEAHAVARELDDQHHRMVAAWGLWSCALYSGQAEETLTWATEFRGLAKTPADQAHGDYLMACAVHINGDLPGARTHIERVVGLGEGRSLDPPTLRFGFNRIVAAHATHAKILWLQGFPDQAMAASVRAVVEAEAVERGITLCFALVEAAANTAMLRGDEASARAWLQRFHAYTTENGLTSQDARSSDIEALLQLGEAGVDVDAPQILAAFGGKGGASATPGLIGDFAERLARRGRIAEAHDLLARTLAGHARHEGHWVRPEIMRALAVVGRMKGGPGAEQESDELLRGSLALAKKTGAWAWRLKTATTMARLWRGARSWSEAADELGEAYGHFAEGFDTADLRAARAELDGAAGRRFAN
jgi:predicted ATPase/DNA-binding winged helix-turn-helix (wHTH) protein